MFYKIALTMESMLECFRTKEDTQLLEQFTNATKTVVSTELTGSKIAKKNV